MPYRPYIMSTSWPLLQHPLAPIITDISYIHCPPSRTMEDIPQVHSCVYPGCNTKFLRQYNLQNHIRSVHTPAPSLSCDACGKRYTRRIDLRRHVTAQHRDETTMGAPQPAAEIAETATGITMNPVSSTEPSSGAARPAANYWVSASAPGGVWASRGG
ncbi:hypothetical protein C2E23DRAFT_620402 [Lenzites betulinus]|nr:hypothetical protein C2E23DRAFT_620402 [Lenzites betulinus]